MYSYTLEIVQILFRNVYVQVELKKTNTWFPSYYAWGYGYNLLGIYAWVYQYHYSYSWFFAAGLYKYFSQNKYSDGWGWFNTKDKDTKNIKSIVKSLANFVKPGDILFYSNSMSKSGIYHAVIVTEVSKNDVKISAHTKARKNESLLSLLKTEKIKCVYALKIRGDAK